MKNILNVLLFCVFLMFYSYFVSHAQAGGTGFITTKSKNGESYRVEFYGELILDTDMRLSSAVMQGKGQYLLDEDENILVTSEKVIRLSTETLTLQINGKPQEFKVTERTKICEGRNALKLDDIKKGDMVTITSEVNQQTALSVRKGPMLFGGMMSSQLILKKYKCDE